jgi:hypothetical protein
MTIIALAAAPVGASPASASSVTVGPASICNTPATYDGRRVPHGLYVCEYGIDESFYGNLRQIWVVGSDGSVYEAWTNCNFCDFGSWTSLGGIAKSPVYFHDYGYWIQISVKGTDGDYWCKWYNREHDGLWHPGQLAWHPHCTA